MGGLSSPHTKPHADTLSCLFQVNWRTRKSALEHIHDEGNAALMHIDPICKKLRDPVTRALDIYPHIYNNAEMEGLGGACRRSRCDREYGRGSQRPEPRANPNPHHALLLCVFLPCQRAPATLAWGSG